MPLSTLWWNNGEHVSATAMWLTPFKDGRRKISQVQDCEGKRQAWCSQDYQNPKLEGIFSKASGVSSSISKLSGASVGPFLLRIILRPVSEEICSSLSALHIFALLWEQRPSHHSFKVSVTELSPLNSTWETSIPCDCGRGFCHKAPSLMH